MNLPYEADPTVLRGPGGITLTLDVREVFPDDPGNGTPALVELRSGTASYECALNEEEVMHERQGAFKLSHNQILWLEAQEPYVTEVWRQGKERHAIREARKEAACAASTS